MKFDAETVVALRELTGGSLRWPARAGKSLSMRQAYIVSLVNHHMVAYALIEPPTPEFHSMLLHNGFHHNETQHTFLVPERLR